MVGFQPIANLKADSLGCSTILISRQELANSQELFPINRYLADFWLVLPFLSNVICVPLAYPHVVAQTPLSVEGPLTPTHLHTVSTYLFKYHQLISQPKISPPSCLLLSPWKGPKVVKTKTKKGENLGTHGSCLKTWILKCASTSQVIYLFLGAGGSHMAIPTTISIC